MKQKYQKGDLVKVKTYRPQSRCRDIQEVEAIVVRSYNDEFGEKHGFSDYGYNSYTLFFKGEGEHSWFDDEDEIIKLVDSQRLDLLELWNEELEDKKIQESSLEWIFNNYEKLKKEGFSINSYKALWSCFTGKDIDGGVDEHLTCIKNGLTAVDKAKPFLIQNDLVGWLEYCEQIKKLKK